MGTPPAGSRAVARRPRSAAAWALPLTLLVGWGAAVGLVWFVVIPSAAAGLMWGSTVDPDERRRAEAASLVALILVVCTPAVTAWLAWRHGWRTAAYCFWALAGLLAVLLFGWMALHRQA